MAKFSWEGTSKEGIRQLLKRDKLYRQDHLMGYQVHKRDPNSGNVGGSKLLHLWFRRDGQILKVTMIHQNNQSLMIRKNTEWFEDGFHPDNYIEQEGIVIWLQKKYSGSRLLKRPVEVM